MLYIHILVDCRPSSIARRHTTLDRPTSWITWIHDMHQHYNYHNSGVRTCIVRVCVHTTYTCQCTCTSHVGFQIRDRVMSSAGWPGSVRIIIICVQCRLNLTKYTSLVIFIIGLSWKKKKRTPKTSASRFSVLLRKLYNLQVITNGNTNNMTLIFALLNKASGARGLSPSLLQLDNQ